MAATAPKRSLFSNRPTWMSSKGATDSAPENTTIFGRDDQTYAAILEEEKRKEQQKRERRDARLKARAEQEKDLDEEPQTKKRRISEEPETKDGSSDAESVKSHRSRDSDHGPVTRSTPKKDKSLLDGLDQNPARKNNSSRSGAKWPSTINLDSDEEEDGDAEKVDELEYAGQSRTAQPSLTASSKLRLQDQETESDDDEQDPYLRELKKKAREKARQQRVEDTKGTSALDTATDSDPPTAKVGSPKAEQTPRISSLSPALETTLIQAKPNTTLDNDDPPVAILIKSEIPNTKPLIVNRRASQPLQQVKDFWCKRQSFDEAFAATVFFTWRGTRLFNSSTMRSILARLKAEKPGTGSPSEDPSQGRIVVEAVTPQIFGHKQKQAEQLQLQGTSLLENNSGVNGANVNDEDIPQPSVEQSYDNESENKAKDGVVIRLKAQGLESMVLRVRPNTSIDKIMRAFQKTREVDPSKRCWLVFDGDRLDPEDLVSTVGFEENDEVEVYPR